MENSKATRGLTLTFFFYRNHIDGYYNYPVNTYIARKFIESLGSRAMRVGIRVEGNHKKQSLTITSLSLSPKVPSPTQLRGVLSFWFKHF